MARPEVLRAVLETAVDVSLSQLLLNCLLASSQLVVFSFCFASCAAEAK